MWGVDLAQDPVRWRMVAISRRAVLAALASSGMAPQSVFAQTETRPLRQIAASKGILFGAAVLASQLKETQFASALARECSLLVPENEMKWNRVEEQRGKRNFTPADDIVNFAKTHNQQLRGHPLLWWHKGFPAWFSQAAGVEGAEPLIRRHIENMCLHFQAPIVCWDVVNEAVEDDETRPNLLRSNGLWPDDLGLEYIDLAFHVAHAAAPNIQLIYNDNETEHGGRKHIEKRKKVLKLLAGFRKRNIPVDGVGLQAHLNAKLNLDEKEFQAFIHEIADMNYVIHITELDVNDGSIVGDIAARDKAVAELTRCFLNAALDEHKVQQLLTWGLSDKHTWLREDKTKLPKDGLQRPLPLDDQFRPKPMMAAIREALLATTDRRAR